MRGGFDAGVDGGCEGRDCCRARAGGESFFVLVSAVDGTILIGRSTNLVRATVAPVSVDELLGEDGSSWQDNP